MLFHLAYQFIDGRDVAAAASVEFNRALAIKGKTDIFHHLTVARASPPPGFAAKGMATS